MSKFFELLFSTPIFCGSKKLTEKEKQERYAKALEECFGAPMITNVFTISEIRLWLREREVFLENGERAIVVKAIPERLRMLSRELDIKTVVDNHLVVAILDRERKITQTLLVRYEELDEMLEETLSKGNGMLVIER